MANDFSELIAGVYDYLGGDAPMKVVTPGVVTQKIMASINLTLTWLNLTDQNWLVSSVDISFDSTNETQTLPATNYGGGGYSEAIPGTRVQTGESLKKNTKPRFYLQDSAP